MWRGLQGYLIGNGVTKYGVPVIDKNEGSVLEAILQGGLEAAIAMRKKLSRSRALKEKTDAGMMMLGKVN